MPKSYLSSWRKERIFSPSLFPSIHYIILMSKSTLPSTQNPMPNSCRASLDTPNPLNPLFLRARDAKIRGLLQNLIIRESKSLFEGKFTDHITIAGESKVLPHLMQRGFEGGMSFLHLYSKKEVKNHKNAVLMMVLHALSY